VGQHFWARGYFVSTVGRDTEVIREYIKKQEEGGQTSGADESVALIATFRWPHDPGPRQRPVSRFERLTT
jgi:hypothetical protein